MAHLDKAHASDAVALGSNHTGANFFSFLIFLLLMRGSCMS